MSGYLNRLIMRTQAMPSSPTLQPFVRSTSPIAEQDQRLSVPGFEALGESSVVSHTALDTDWTLDEGDAVSVQDSMPQDISGNSSVSSDITIQRKVADTPSGSVMPALYIAPRVSPAHRSSDIPSAAAGSESSLGFIKGEQPGLSTPSNWNVSTQSDRPPSSLASKPSPVAGLSENPSITHEQGRVIEPVVPQSQPQPDMPTSSARGFARTEVTKVIRQIPPSAVPLRPPARETDPKHTAILTLEQNISPENVRSRKVALQRSDEVPQLEPSMRRRVDDDVMIFEAGTQADSASRTTPSVVIGRVNVEVMPPAQENTGSTARSGPLTAASVSVIGPLRRGVRPNLRFSLRQR